MESNTSTTSKLLKHLLKIIVVINILRFPKLLVQQQQQQQQQQMAGGTVTPGLPTNVKTVNNTLVNNQQVAQPQTTVWQQSTVTEQG